MVLEWLVQQINMGIMFVYVGFTKYFFKKNI